MKSVCLLMYTLFASLPLLATQQQPLATTWQLQTAARATQAPGENWTEVSASPFAWKRVIRRLPDGEAINVDEVGSLWYRQAFNVPEEWAGNRLKLDFLRIEGDSIVFCNGKRIGELLRPGGEIDISDAAHTGSNDLLVFVTRDYTDISRGFEADKLRYISRAVPGNEIPMKSWGLGITADVNLISLPPAAITDVFIQTSWRQKEITLDCTLDLLEPVSNTRLEGTIRDEAGKEVLTLASDLLHLNAGRQQQMLRSSWQNPIPWDLDAPYLYTLDLKLIKDDTVLDARPGQRFGFREIWTEGRHVYLNGHISRWRIEWTNFGLNENSISMLKLIGRNVVYQQNNHSAWWRAWAETPLVPEATINLLDEHGVGLLMVAPSVARIKDSLLTDPDVHRDFVRETELWIKRYRNHPSILAWCVSMNSYNPRDAIHPDTMGQKRDYNHAQTRAINEAADIVRSFDPGRLLYAHADGNFTDIASANTYPNFTPLQEVEDYPEIYAEKGDMPYFAAEYALPYSGSWYKGSQFLGTEYSAIYFGDEAYRAEPDALLQDLVPLGLGNRGHGNSIAKAIPNFPMYWKLRELYVTRSDRTWRTWGVQGWHNFNFGLGYGDPPGKKISKFSRYSVMTEPVTSRPDWANPNFDIHSKNMQPLLAYVAGSPTFTDKTHAFASGEMIQKQIALVWDGPGDKVLNVTWQLLHQTTILAAGETPMRLSAGDIRFVPVEAKAPETLERMDLTLRMLVYEDEQQVASDRFELSVHPDCAPPKVTGKVAIWDPKGDTAPWVQKLGIAAQNIEPGTSLAGYQLLIVGREAIAPGTLLPWKAQDLANGLEVLICEQQPEIWQGLGLLADDLHTRRVFITDHSSGMVTGLQDQDLWDWRGTTDLLPAFHRQFDHDALRAPKGSNRNTVAPVVLRIPSVVGFKPVLSCEFDLDYSPLLRWEYGSGGITYCTLELSSRVGVEPAATRLAANMLATLGNPDEGKTRMTTVLGRDTALRDYALGAQPDPGDPAETLLVVGPETSLQDQELMAAFREGAVAVILPRSAESLTADGYAVTEKKLYHAPPPAGDDFATIGPSLLRWRDGLTAAVFTPEGQPKGSMVYSDGLFLVQPQGKGVLFFCQASDQELATRYADDKAKDHAIRLSIFRLRQMTARILTNCGATASEELAARLCQLRAGSAFEDLKTWHTLGPFYPESEDPRQELPRAFPGEEAAIAGDINPNLTYPRADGTLLDFRKTVTADSSGFVDLSEGLSKGTALCYVTRVVQSPVARKATLRLGVDYFMYVWCNGELVYRLDHGHSSPKPNRHLVNLNLKEGDNVLTIKLLSGSKGFGFWANLAKPGAIDLTREPQPEVPLYPSDIAFFDPYEYHYW